MLKQGLLFLSESGAAKKLITGTPLTRSMSRRFVPGEKVEDVIKAARSANAAGLKVTANYLGEAEKSPASAEAASRSYMEVLKHLQSEGLDGNVSVKFTQLGQAISEECLGENLVPLLEQARDGGTFIRFDMESSDYTRQTLDSFEKLWDQGWDNIGVVLQAYLRRTSADVTRMVGLGARVRLCKGAYAEPAEVAFQSREQVDSNFIGQMKVLLSQGNYPAIATHDEAMISATVDFASAAGVGKDRFEFQMLYGVRRDLQRDLIARGYNVRAYIPFGESWYPYLMRRLAERPANVMFMAGSMIKDSPLRRLWPSRHKAETT